MRTCYLNLRASGPNPDRDEILEIALLDDAGAILLDSFVHPCLPTIWPDAWQVARIAPEDVANAPLINELHPNIIEAVWDARVVIYNAADHAPLLREVLAHAAKVRCAIIEAVWDARVVIYNAADHAPLLREVLAHAAKVRCAMQAYASAADEYAVPRDAVQCPPLGVAAAHVGHVWTGRPHRALAACRATRAVWHWTNAQAAPNQITPAAPHAHRPER
jgi:DNA polymerase-3 subunit epsilon